VSLSDLEKPSEKSNYNIVMLVVIILALILIVNIIWFTLSMKKKPAEKLLENQPKSKKKK
jgi:flagellar basal body-associated protein FliL